MRRNILITSAGKRVALVRAFQQELKSLIRLGKVYTTDMNPEMAPACIVSDEFFTVPPVTAPEYIDDLLSICLSNDIGLVVPTIDTELLLLAQNKQRFENAGIVVCVPGETFVSLCRDKRKTITFFDRIGIRVPRQIDKSHPTFPLFAKPFDGSLSRNLHIIRCAEELTPQIMGDSKLIFMELIDKTEYQEFTVDMYYGKDNVLKSVVPRERVEIRAGEINKGYTRKNEIIDFLRERMGYVKEAIGCICLQIFFHPHEHEIIGIEINPRFGGGYPLSYAAGANFPAYLIREYLLGEKIEYSDSWTDNLLMLRYDDAVFVG